MKKISNVLILNLQLTADYVQDMNLYNRFYCYKESWNFW